MRILRSSRWFLFFLLAALGCSSKAAPEPVWIGQLLPLDGPNRTVGQHVLQGVEQAIAESQTAELTGNAPPRAVLHVDSHGDPGSVQAETVRLLTVNKAVALLADFDASLTERLLRTNQSYGVPVIVPGELATAPDTNAVRSLGISPALRGRLLAGHASADLHLQRAAVLTDSRSPVAAVLAAAFVKSWPRTRGSTVEEWTFTTSTERDERTTRLLQAAPTVILLACSVSDFRALGSRLAAALPKVPLLHGGEDSGAVPFQAGLEARPDVYLATAYSPDHLTELGRAFARSYEERFHEPPDLYAAQAYDAARLLFDTMQRTGNTNKDALVKEVARLELFDSVTGPVHWKDHQPSRRVFLIALKNNQAKVVRVIEPEDN
jgi:branched-chain amino acid transport system substrate-binding protein